jgi:hypothetical protein
MGKMARPETEKCLSLSSIAPPFELEINVNPVAASNMKSVQFRQSLNLPVGLTNISLNSRPARPEVDVHFLPMSERLSPKTTTECIFNGPVVGAVLVGSVTPLSIPVSSRFPAGDTRRSSRAPAARTVTRLHADHNGPNWRAPSGRARAALARKTIDVDIRGHYAVYGAASLSKVGCIVFASTNHVTGHYEQEGLVSHPDRPVRPDGIYGAGKAFGEALGRYYAERLGVRVYCIRIANFNGLDEPGHAYAPGKNRWLSPRDAASLVWCCIAAEHVPFGIFYGVSRGADTKWDLTPNKEILGWEPQDDGTLPEFRARYAGQGDRPSRTRA